MRESAITREGQALVDAMRAAAEPLPDIDDPAFGDAFDRFGDARVVLLGEASHGTSEFYRARAAITRRLIERHGFTIVAAEADWPDAATIDRIVRHKAPRIAGGAFFDRFPTWMWKNKEMLAFIGWLRDHNAALPPERRAGFYGLDLYNLNGSIRAVIDYLDRVDPEAAQLARIRYGCIRPYSEDPAVYGRLALTEGFSRCETAVVEMLTDLFARSREQGGAGDEELFDAAANARLIANAEAYYRVIYYGSTESWNLRDRHMFSTLDLLLSSKSGGKAVVWAHNSHIGDARFTDMGNERHELNLGQLCREAMDGRAQLIGFGTHTGTVAAATDWDGPMAVKRVMPSRPDSYERIAHDTGLDRFLLDMRAGQNQEARAALMQPRLERFIGVIYRPETERWSHYSGAILPEQFDAYVWFDRTRAVTPLSSATGHEGGEETWPFGL